MKKSVAALILITTMNHVFAQTDLAIYDADGDRIGALVGTLGPNDEFITIRTADGYLIRIDSQSGRWIQRPQSLGFLLTAFVYPLTGCDGDAFVVKNSATEGWGQRGGEIFQVGNDAESPGWGKIEWGAGTQMINRRSFYNPQLDACTDADSVEIAAIPVTIINPSNYGIGVLPDNSYGFAPPLTSSIEMTENIHCNGFETCPSK